MSSVGASCRPKRRSCCDGPICRAIRSLQQLPTEAEIDGNEDLEYFSANEEPVGDETGLIFTLSTTLESSFRETSLDEDIAYDGDDEDEEEDPSEDDDEDEEEDPSDDDDEDEDDNDGALAANSPPRPHSNPCMNTCLFIDRGDGCPKCYMHFIVIVIGGLFGMCEPVHVPIPVEERETDWEEWWDDHELTRLKGLDWWWENVEDKQTGRLFAIEAVSAKLGRWWNGTGVAGVAAEAPARDEDDEVVLREGDPDRRH